MNKSPSRQSPQQWSKAENQVFDEIDHILERFKNRFTIDNPRFVERYIKGELDILLEFRYIGDLVERHPEFVAHFQRASSARERHGNRDGTDLRVAGVNGPSLLSGERLHNAHSQERRGDEGCHVNPGNEQRLVLVDNIEFMQPPHCVIPSLIRLAPVDSFYSSSRHALYFSVTLGFVFRGVLKNREASLFPRLTLRDGNQMERQVIQSRAQVVDDIPGDSGKSERGIGGANDVILDSLRNLRIGLGPRFIRLGVQKGAEFNLEITEMLFGPVNFNADLGKPVIGDSRT